MAAGDLTTLANVKAAAGRTDSTSDALIQRLITAVSAFVGSYTGRDNLGQVKTYSEIRDGHGGADLFIANGPLVSVTSLLIDDTVSVPAQSAAGQPGYFIVTPANDVVSLYAYALTRGRRNVRITYQAGYTTAPFDIEEACIEAVIAQLDRLPRVEQESLSKQGQSIRYSQRDLPPFAKSILDQWRRVATP